MSDTAYGAFVSEMGSFADLLAELHYVERAYAYLSDQEAANKAPRGADEKVLKVPATFIFEIGWTHEFDYVAEVTDDSYFEQTCREHLKVLKTEADDWAFDEVRALIGKARPITSTTQDHYTSLVDGLVTARDSLDLTDTDLDSLAGSLTSWTGHAADMFRLNFEDGVDDCVRNGRGLIAGSAKAVTAMQVVVRGAQESLVDLAGTAKEVADALLITWQQEQTPKTESKEYLSMASDVSKFVGELIPVKPVGLAASVLSAGLGALSDNVPDDIDRGAPEVLGSQEGKTLEASSASGLADNVRSAIVQTIERMDSGLDEVALPVAQLLDLGDAAWSVGDLFPPEPGLADVTPPGFHHAPGLPSA